LITKADESLLQSIANKEETPQSMKAMGQKLKEAE